MVDRKMECLLMFLKKSKNVKDISPNHWRTQAVIVHTLECDILVINSYFPTDPKTQNFDAADLLSPLDAINEVLNTNKFDHVVWAGDLMQIFIEILSSL